MRGLLTNEGELKVFRKDGLCTLHCPYTDSLCGTWCPQFTEPIRRDNDRLNRVDTIVHLCHGKHWKFTEFEDQRPSASKAAHDGNQDNNKSEPDY